MVTKTKTIENIAQNLGMLLMATAAVVGSVDFAAHPKRAVIIPNKPVLQFATENGSNNPLRREREETAPHFISYSEIQRTPGRAGKY